MDIAGVEEKLLHGGCRGVEPSLRHGKLKPVDIFAGPRNRYVLKQSAGERDRWELIMLAGPSEVVIIADGRQTPNGGGGRPCPVEHDPNSWTVIVTTSKEPAEKTSGEILRQRRSSPRKTALEAWRNNGGTDRRFPVGSSDNHRQIAPNSSGNDRKQRKRRRS